MEVNSRRCTELMAGGAVVAAMLLVSLGASRIFHSYVVPVVCLAYLGITSLLGRGRDEAMLGHSAVDSLRDSTFPSQPMSTGAFRWIADLRGCGVQECQGSERCSMSASRPILNYDDPLRIEV